MGSNGAAGAASEGIPLQVVLLLLVHWLGHLLFKICNLCPKVRDTLGSIGGFLEVYTLFGGITLEQVQVVVGGDR